MSPMSFGDVITFVGFITLAIALAGIAYSAYSRKLRFKERELELRLRLAETGEGESEPDLTRIEERLRVLERIATDKSSVLADQIEDLRSPAA